MPQKVTSRRKFIKYLSFAGGSLAMGDMGALFTFKDEATPDLVAEMIKQQIKGQIVKDHLLVEEYQTDFGRVIRKEPRLIVVPQDDDDIITVFRIAEKYQVPVSLRGAGHTCYGQSLSDGGILIVNNSRLAESEATIKDGLVTVHSRTQWLALEKQLNGQGLTSPVLTDYLELTVGGTLSVGGYGLRSFQYGAQVDNIKELELILPSGEKTTCSPEKNTDLFRYSLCGLGQLGLISKVKFKPIPYQRYTSVFYVLCTSVKDFIKNIKTILHPDFIKEIDHFSSYWLNGTFIIEIGSSFIEENKAEEEKLKKKIGAQISFYKNSVVKDYHLYLHQIRGNWVERYGVSHHVWEDYIFGIDQLEEFLNRAISETKISQYQNILPALYIVACDTNQTRGIPFSPTYGNNNPMVYSVGFYYMVKYGNSSQLQTAKEHHQGFMKSCLELKGKPYLYGWHDLTENQKIQFYGEDYTKLKSLKKQHDPANIINPGVFVNPGKTAAQKI
ncbi:MAG: FAD-binding oxidoreductase [Proteobacteria bacterium]|nr:FAD-binding oxidoreductase [Pseudomonadota bacterium]MBU1715668.1 FAD-binding oxidoreductase [Pseudomonadota bacterium]